MTHTVTVDFDRARTNVVDGFQAMKSGDSSDVDHFASEAKAAMDIVINISNIIPISGCSFVVSSV